MEKLKPKRGPYTVEKRGGDWKVTGPHGIEKGTRVEQLNTRKAQLENELKEVDAELEFLQKD